MKHLPRIFGRMSQKYASSSHSATSTKAIFTKKTMVRYKKKKTVILERNRSYINIYCIFYKSLNTNPIYLDTLNIFNCWQRISRWIWNMANLMVLLLQATVTFAKSRTFWLKKFSSTLHCYPIKNCLHCLLRVSF